VCEAPARLERRSSGTGPPDGGRGRFGLGFRFRLGFRFGLGFGLGFRFGLRFRFRDDGLLAAASE
jgi:hypothetical protein